MKRLIYSLMVLCFLVTATPALAQGPSLIIDAQRVTSDVPPQIISGRVLVPLRVISESLGAQVAWENQTKTAYVNVQDKVLKLQLNKKVSYVNSTAVNLDVPPQMVASRTLVPLRFIGEQMEADVAWSNADKTVSITRKPVEETPPAQEEEPVEESKPASRQLTSMDWQEVEEQSTLTFKVQQGSHKVFELKNPDRIVVDLADTELQVKEDITLNSLFVSAVKFGEHPNNTARIVLEVRDRSLVKYEVKQQGDELMINLNRQEAPTELTSPTVPDGYVNKIINAQSKVVVIDPGHGGRDVGTTGVSGNWEKTLNLAIAQKLQSLLESQGYTVIMTRSDADTYVSLEERTVIANASEALCFISIHANAAGSSSAGGLETYTFYGTDRTLASLVQKEILARTGQVDRKVKESGFYVIKHTKIPAVLVETGFLSNSQEEQFLFNPDNQQAIAEALAEAVNEFKKIVSK